MLAWVPNNGWEVGCSLGYQIMDGRLDAHLGTK